MFAYSFNYKVIVIIIRNGENTFEIVFEFYVQNTPIPNEYMQNTCNVIRLVT